ncbi:MAG: hypothetical protein M3250_09795 [Thermoproteota archaeon]|nr:hypothetical protein [Thermoproteota archaeon]
MTKNLISKIFVKKEDNLMAMEYSIDHDTNSSSSSSHDEQQKHKQHSQDHQQQQYQDQQQHHQPPASKQYNVNLQYDPITPEAQKATKLIISISDQRIGDPIRDFELLHDKLLHLIIVGEDLSYFAHIHPTLEDNGENFTIFHTFPESGRYKLWIEFKPKDGNQTLVAFMIKVSGYPVHKYMPLVYDRKYIKESLDRKYQISLKLPEKLVSHTDADIVFSVSDVAGNPVTDLEPLMGAGGHSVIISSDIKEFLHVHPTEEVDPISWKGGPTISFKTNFPKPGLYKTWGQFQHKGRTIIADFSLEVI